MLTISSQCSRALTRPQRVAANLNAHALLRLSARAVPEVHQRFFVQVRGPICAEPAQQPRYALRQPLQRGCLVQADLQAVMSPNLKCEKANGCGCAVLL